MTTIGSLGRTSLTLTCLLIDLLTRTLVSRIGLLARKLLPKIDLLKQIVLVQRIYLNEYYYQ